MKNTKADAAAYRALPALRTSCKWHKRECLRTWRARLDVATSPRMRAYIMSKITELRSAPPVAFRASYIGERVAEIRSAPLFALSCVLGDRMVRA